MQNIVRIPHPAWFAVADLVPILPLAWIGARLAMGRGAAVAPP